MAAAETPPPELACLADELTITLPWGSLLAGVLGRDHRVAAGITSLVAPGGIVRSIVSTASCDGRSLAALDDRLAAAIADTWAGHDLTVATFRPATAAELARTHSTWARRLGLSGGRATTGTREAWLIELRRRRGTDAPPAR